MKPLPCPALISFSSLRRAGSLLVAMLCLGMVATGRAQTPGTLDPGFTTSTGNIVQVAPQPDGKIVYNVFTEYSRSSPLRLNADGTPDAAFNPAANTGILLATQPDGKTLTGLNRAGMNYYDPMDELFRLNPDGTLDSNFTVYSPGYSITNASVQPDGKIIVGSDIYFRGSYNPIYLTRLNADGSVDKSFGAGFNGPVAPYNGSGGTPPITSITTQPDGKILVSGRMYGNVVMYYPYYGYSSLILVRLNTDGSTDATFTYGGDTEYIVNAVALQPDGKILVGSNTFANASSTVSEPCRPGHPPPQC